MFNCITISGCVKNFAKRKEKKKMNRTYGNLRIILPNLKYEKLVEIFGFIFPWLITASYHVQLLRGVSSIALCGYRSQEQFLVGL